MRTKKSKLAQICLLIYRKTVCLIMEKNYVLCISKNETVILLKMSDILH